MPSIGKDLAKIRSHLGLSIQDIQHNTKIPVSTLTNIENDSIFSHPEENQTYIRSFVRSYGRALKIDDDTLIKALDQNETGNYNHLLLQKFPELSHEKTRQPEQQTDSTHPEKEQTHQSPDLDSTQYHSDPTTESHDQEEAPEETPVSQKPESPVSSSKSDPVSMNKPAETQQKKESADTSNSPSVRSVNWADVGRKFSEEKKHTPAWIVGLIIVLIITAFVGYFLYENGFFDFGNVTTPREQVEPENETTPSSLTLDIDEPDQNEAALDGSESNEETPAPAASNLDDVLFLTVYAAYDGLGPVRVWSDIKPRMDPYWLEQGQAMRFEFRDTIRVRGPYSNLLLYKDGHLIGNAEQQFLQQEEDYIELTRSFFSSDPKWATSISFELPEGVPTPDSVSTRPTF